ncbi:hypothetical protein PACTADRAFT_32140 [Pachysolen tannophilus NRRL Y-2460]|uniref:RIC1 C-terminal alpha solenoid region domain-containing protein n=1 Tax=Pachysolen tannophilus NRRL Y-2460 TaxID=669874 RepID=A0A1E4TY00_PACTA|nr:hypothetical protein PACTADRAFT_32140 [Pachysolen tannophilus NRRL Y-2460]
MIWPSSSPHIFGLPKNLPPATDSERKEDQYDDNDYEVLDLILNIKNLPYAVITKKGIYLINAKTNSVIGVHLRSDESLASYGENIKIKRSTSGFNFIVQTSKNFLMIYTIFDLNENSNTNSLEEVLTIYSKDQNSSKILQNGFPLQNSNEQNFKSFLTNLFAKNELEFPNYDFGLRYKIVLKIQSDLLDFIPLQRKQLLLITKEPNALQLIHIGDKHNGSNIEVTLIDELDWYKKDRSQVKYIEYNTESENLYWVNEKGNVWCVKVLPQNNNAITKFSGNCIYESNDEDSPKINKFAINNNFNLITLVTDTCDLLVNKFKDTSRTSIHLIKIIKKLINIRSNHILTIKVSPCGTSTILLFDNGWNIYSCFGNLNFSTYDYLEEDHSKLIFKDKNWFNSLINCNFSNNNELIFINHKKIFLFNLVKLNSILHQNSLTLKRPILYNNDNISVFRGYEKPLIDYNSSSEVVNNKENELWYHISLPTTFKLKNNRIVSLTASADGNYLCCIGNKDLIIYNSFSKNWKFLINDYYTTNPIVGEFQEISSNNIIDSLWYQNHLILAIKADENSTFGDINQDDNDNLEEENLKPTTELLLFSNLIWNEDTEFNTDLVIWSFGFNNQEFINKKTNEPRPRSKPKEDFLYFNIDNDELVVLTTELNCYLFKISKQTDKKHGQGLSHTTRSEKAKLALKCERVLSLKKIFNPISKKQQPKFDPKSIKSINKINENDLLILVNGDVIYLRESIEEEEDLASSVSTSTVDLVHNINNRSSTSLSSLNSGAKSPRLIRSNSKQSLASPSMKDFLEVKSPKPPKRANTRPSIKFERILLLQGIEYLHKINSTSISAFNGINMIFYDLNILLRRSATGFNLFKVKPLIVNINDDNTFGMFTDEEYKREEVIMSEALSKLSVSDSTNGSTNSVDNNSNHESNKNDKKNFYKEHLSISTVIQHNHSNFYPLLTILEKNLIIGLEIDLKVLNCGKNNSDENLKKENWFNFKNLAVKKNFLNNLIDYYLKIGSQAAFKSFKEEEIFEKFHRFKNYQFSLELLMLNYLKNEQDDDHDLNYFNKLINLIRISCNNTTNGEYILFLSFLKKIEVKYWFKFFKNLQEAPRNILMNKILPSNDYKLSSHYLILAMNYEKEEENHSKNNQNKNNNNAGKIISKKDEDLIFKILKSLFEKNDYPSCFELIRFIKLVDDKNNITDKFINDISLKE